MSPCPRSKEVQDAVHHAELLPGSELVEHLQACPECARLALSRSFHDSGLISLELDNVLESQEFSKPSIWRSGLSQWTAASLAAASLLLLLLSPWEDAVELRPLLREPQAHSAHKAIAEPERLEALKPEIESAKEPEQPSNPPEILPQPKQPRAALSRKRKRRKRARARFKPSKTFVEDRSNAHRPARVAPKLPVRHAHEVDDLLGALDGKPSARSRPKPVTADPLLPEKLSRQQILRVIKRGVSSVRSCRQGEGGTVTVRMKIVKSGKVQSAQAKGKFSGTQTGSCVESKVRAFRFPRFNGMPVSFNIPFVL